MRAIGGWDLIWRLKCYSVLWQYVCDYFMNVFEVILARNNVAPWG